MGDGEEEDEDDEDENDEEGEGDDHEERRITSRKNGILSSYFSFMS